MVACAVTAGSSRWRSTRRANAGIRIHGPGRHARPEGSRLTDDGIRGARAREFPCLQIHSANKFAERHNRVWLCSNCTSACAEVRVVFELTRLEKVHFLAFCARFLFWFSCPSRDAGADDDSCVCIM